MNETELKRLDGLMSERDHLTGIGDGSVRARLHMNLADEIPGLVAEVRRLNLQVKLLEEEGHKLIDSQMQRAEAAEKALRDAELQVNGSNATITALQMALDSANLQLSEAKSMLAVIVDAGALEDCGKLGEVWTVKILTFLKGSPLTEKPKCECRPDCRLCESVQSGDAHGCSCHTEKRIEEPLFLCRAAAYDVISRGLTPCPNKMPCAQHKPCEACGRPTGGCCTVAVQR